MKTPDKAAIGWTLIGTAGLRAANFLVSRLANSADIQSGLGQETRDGELRQDS